MTKGSLKGLGKLSLALLLAASLNGAAFAGVAPVEGAATAMSPASNAAVVNKLIGMVNNRAAKSLIDTKVTINDGIVIRKSFIKDGKIVIPSEGLYTTARAGNFYPFEGYPITINGKMYRKAIKGYSKVQVKLPKKYCVSIVLAELRDRGFEVREARANGRSILTIEW